MRKKAAVFIGLCLLKNMIIHSLFISRSVIFRAEKYWNERKRDQFKYDLIFHAWSRKIAKGNGTWDIESSIYRHGCDLMIRHVLTEKRSILLFVCCFDYLIAVAPISQLESPIKMWFISNCLMNHSRNNDLYCSSMDNEIDRPRSSIRNSRLTRQYESVITAFGAFTSNDNKIIEYPFLHPMIQYFTDNNANDSRFHVLLSSILHSAQ